MSTTGCAGAMLDFQLMLMVSAFSMVSGRRVLRLTLVVLRFQHAVLSPGL